MKPGVSVARMALQCGVNANLLRRWIAEGMGADTKTSRASMRTMVMADAYAFVPLRLTSPGQDLPLQLRSKFGYTRDCPMGWWSTSAMRARASCCPSLNFWGACHVPARRHADGGATALVA